MSPTAAQLRAIWGAAKRQGVDESTLRDLVEFETGARSISAMTPGQAAKVLSRLLGSGPTTKNQKPKTPRPAGEPNALALPTAEQKRMVEQLAARAGFDEDGLRAWAKAALGFERATDRGRAHRLIEALKSHLVRRLDLPARCARLIAADDREAMLTTRERQVIEQVSTVAGRGRNRVAAGGILWAIDLCGRFLAFEAQITKSN